MPNTIHSMQSVKKKAFEKKEAKLEKTNEKKTIEKKSHNYV